MNQKKDYHNYKHVNNPRAKSTVETMMDTLDLNDIWRKLNPECSRYTWRRSYPFQQARLDFFLISDPVVTFVEDADIECGCRTDYSAIVLNITV